MFETETAPIASMGMADLLIGEVYTQAMMGLTVQLKDDAEGWEATGRQEDISMIPIETVNMQATGWHGYLKERNRELRQEIEARLQTGETMPPQHVASHTVFEPRKKE